MLPPFSTVSQNYVLCLDTLGQDRIYSDHQIAEVFQLAWLFKNMWDAKEEALLTADRERRMKERAELKEYIEKDGPKIIEDEKNYVSSKTADEATEDKDFMEKYYRFCFLTTQIVKGVLCDLLKTYPQYSIPKYSQIFLALFYLLKIPRNQLCYPNTNILNWKVAKGRINNELIQQIAEFNPRGPKDVAPPKYMLVNKILTLVSDLKEEEVEQNAYLMAQLLRWVKYAVEIRMEDIKRRKVKYLQLLEARANQQKQNDELVKEKEESLAKAREEAKASWKAPEPKEGEDASSTVIAEFKFDDEGFLKEWDAAHPSIVIEDVPAPDKDNDYEEAA